MPARRRQRLSPGASALLTALLIVASIAAPMLGRQAYAQPPRPHPNTQSPAPWGEPTDEFGAIAFTADGSFSSVWKLHSKEEAEARVRAECAKFQRGECEVMSFGAAVCAAIASATIGEERKITYAGGGLDPPDAQATALKRCNRDKRAKGTCELRTVVCGDGR